MDGTRCKIDDCERPGTMARGWCGPHYKRWWRHGDPLAGGATPVPANATPDQRLRHIGWTARDVRAGMTPCFEWAGLLDRRDYGRIWDGERVTSAHRLAYRAWVGPIADDVLIRHHCDNPMCIRPDHLGVGDDRINAADAVQRERTPNGERMPHKLTDADVARIRDEFTGAPGQVTALAKRYGVSVGYMSMLTRGRTRTNVTHWEAVLGDIVALGAGRAQVRTPPPFVGNTRRAG